MNDGVKGAWSLWSSEGCAIRHGSHQPHVATEHQECGQSKLRCATIVKRVPESKGLVLTKKKKGGGMKHMPLIFYYLGYIGVHNVMIKIYFICFLLAFFQWVTVKFRIISAAPIVCPLGRAGPEHEAILGERS